jgi:hypothetical protein
VGTDATCEDGGTVGPLSVHGWRRVFFRVHLSGLVFGEGADAAPEGFARDTRGMRAMRLRRWSTVLVRHGGGEGGHYFSADAARIWRQMLQVILRYPYAGVDFSG